MLTYTTARLETTRQLHLRTPWVPRAIISTFTFEDYIFLNARRDALLAGTQLVPFFLPYKGRDLDTRFLLLARGHARREHGGAATLLLAILGQEIARAAEVDGGIGRVVLGLELAHDEEGERDAGDREGEAAVMCWGACVRS